MAQFIFNPVPSDESNTLAQELVNNFTALGGLSILRNTFATGKGKGLMRNLKLGCLRNVTAGDTVYIFMHGSATGGSTRVSMNRGSTQTANGVDWVGGTVKDYDMPNLARVLESEGLPKNFKHLHLMTCGSGYAGNEKTDDWYADHNQTVPASRMAPLAWRLKFQLNQLGYSLVSVTGYKGWVIPDMQLNNWFVVRHDGDPYAGNDPRVVVTV